MAGIEIPATVGFRERQFDLAYIQSLTPSGAGTVQTIQRTSPMWVAEYTTPPLADTRYNDAVAFIDALEGSLATFLAYDPSRVMPYAYRHLPVSADPWTAVGYSAPRVTGQNYAASQLYLDQLLPGAIISAGDYISVFDGTAWWLYRVMSGAIANGAGLAGVAVKPRPTIGGTLPLEIRYRKACAEMKMMPNSFDKKGSVSNPDSISFKAFQFIRRAS